MNPIPTLLKQNKITQEEMAAHLYMTRQYFNQKMRKPLTLRLWELIEIARILKMKPSKLIKMIGI